MADDLFADENFAVSAVYSAHGTEAERAVTVLLTEPSRDDGFGNTGAIVRETRIWIRVSEISCAARGDTFVIGDILYVVEKSLPTARGITAELTLKRKN